MSFDCKCTEMRSLLFPMQENTKQILSRATGSKRYKEDKWELDQSKPWQLNKAIQSKNQYEDGLQVPPQLRVSLVMDK